MKIRVTYQKVSNYYQSIGKCKTLANDSQCVLKHSHLKGFVQAAPLWCSVSRVCVLPLLTLFGPQFTLHLSESSPLSLSTRACASPVMVSWVSVWLGYGEKLFAQTPVLVLLHLLLTPAIS